MSEVKKIDLPLYKRGKVRDVYEAGENLLIVASDRLSAFDWVLPTLIPDKGKVLNRVALFWFEQTGRLIPNHVLCGEPEKLAEFAVFGDALTKRSVLVRRLRVFPVEAVVRGYLVGSGWLSYEKSGEVCGVKLPAGLKFADRLPEPIFTPTTKAETGHDENITFTQLQGLIGTAEAVAIRDLSLKLFYAAGEIAASRGIILADSKFEFGRGDDNRMMLADEIFTPDSSRFWRQTDWQPGLEPPSFDKQFVRNWLLKSSWDRHSPPPGLPVDVVEQTRALYLEIHRILTGSEL
jgi:phosphoribosylaminoimidazole-succinocarboxamide synthase